jgi:hypothetical protein
MNPSSGIRVVRSPKSGFLDRSIVKVAIGLAFAAIGVVLAGAGGAVLVKPALTLGIGIAGDYFTINGTLPGILLLGLGILATSAFIAADRLDSYLPVRAAAVGLVAAGGYAFARQRNGMLWSAP